MKLSRLIVLLLLSGPVLAEPFILVEDAKNPCADFGCMYYEWRIPSLPDVRYIASGYEDGIDYAFYRVSDDGSHDLLLHVNPIIVDSDGKYWWGYPWITTGLVLEDSGDSIYVRGTFDHSIVREGVHSIPEWQKTLPVVLFEGNQGIAKQPEYVYYSCTIAELIEGASGS
jgi:hypothetical protein